MHFQSRLQNGFGLDPVLDKHCQSSQEGTRNGKGCDWETHTNKGVSVTALVSFWACSWVDGCNPHNFRLDWWTQSFERQKCWIFKDKSAVWPVSQWPGFRKCILSSSSLLRVASACRADLLLSSSASGKFTNGGATSGDEEILGNLLAEELSLKACQ